MNEDNHKLRLLLKDALPPETAPDLTRDLWPQMLRRIDAQPARVSVWDWAMAAFLAAGCLLVPELLPVLLYHL